MSFTAPYNSAMRLGQGFNSYKQQICVDNAVTITATPSTPTKSPTDTKTVVPVKPVGKKPDPAKPIDTTTEVVELVDHTGEKCQTVTYTAKFVDKLSDVTDAMNISGGLAIKYGTVSGEGNGSYVDANKFKDSDLNFLIKVSVTNQAPIVQESYVFNKIEGFDNMDKPEESEGTNKFSTVYGDCFISGFLEGGELTGLVSMKILDQNSKTKIAADLKAAFTAGAAKVEGQIHVDIDKEKTSHNTETTVNVNWSGGGQVKTDAEKWDINTLFRVAAAFPKMIAQCPQRTTALLTKYTACKDFVAKYPKYSSPNYENASSYTADLLDDYMDYKTIWRRLNDMHDEPQKYIKNELWKDTKLSVTPQSDNSTEVPSEGGVHHLNKGPKKVNDTHQVAKPVQRSPRTVPYEATPIDLDDARRYCKRQMNLIVQEVDLIAAQPNLVAKGGREFPYDSPGLFSSLLPIPKSEKLVEAPKPDVAPIPSGDPITPPVTG